MKKNIIFIMLFLLFVLNIYCQTVTVSDIINDLISYLNKPVPEGFQRVNRYVFGNDLNITLEVENEIVILSSFGRAFYTTHEASNHNTFLYEYFENYNNNWNFYRSLGRYDIYVKNGVYAGIMRPLRRDDGLIVVQLLVSMNINNYYF
jgi:hypothetical protein